MSCLKCPQTPPPPSPPKSTLDFFLSTPFLGLGQNGGHAEYVVVDEQTLVPVVSHNLILLSDQ